MSAETQLELLVRPNVLPFVLMGLGIVVFGFTSLVTTCFRHRERMAMIRAGMHPDARQKVASATKTVKGDAGTEKAAAVHDGSWSDWSPPRD